MAEVTTVDPTCPRCGPQRPLGAEAGVLRARRCGACGGALVPFATSAAVRAQLPPAAAGGAALSCPGCAGPLRLGTFRGEAFGSCPACALLWLDAAPLAWATARAEAPAAPRPAPLPPAPPSRTPWLVAGAAVAVLILGGGAYALWGRSPVAAAPAAPAAPVVAPAAPLPAGPVEPARELWGGRPAAWWQERLDALAARGDPEARELREWTLSRARANGLQISEEAGRVRVSAPAAGGGTP